MKFNNIVAYCKGFYKTREGDVPQMWKDMAHCIECDGYVVMSKKDVERFCLNFIDEYARDFPHDAWRVSFSMLYRKIMENKDIAKHYSPIIEAEIDDVDLLIWTFRDFVRYNMDDKHFDYGVIPNEFVLPLYDDVSDTLWNKITSRYKEQDFSAPYYSTFDEIEEKINNMC